MALIRITVPAIEIDLTGAARRRFGQMELPRETADSLAREDRLAAELLYTNLVQAAGFVAGLVATGLIAAMLFLSEEGLLAFAVAWFATGAIYSLGNSSDWRGFAVVAPIWAQFPIMNWLARRQTQAYIAGRLEARRRLYGLAPGA